MKQVLKGFFFLLCLLMVPSSMASARSISVLIDNQPLNMPTPAIIHNDRVLVPMRTIMETLGYEVVWHAESKTIEATNENVSLLLTIDNPVVVVNGEKITLDTMTTLYESTTMVPLRFLSVSSGCDVAWDAQSSTVFITTGPTATDKMAESIVYIQTNKMQGSGIILSTDGLIATNYHVLEGASSIQIMFHDKEIYQGVATVVGLDPQNDIALLRIDKKNLTPAEISSSIIKNETIYAIGSPLGKHNVITSGTLSGYSADIISFTAPINHGSSGGGLFNARGQLIGMTSGFNTDTYLAIPISAILDTPRKLSMPISGMASYIYTPQAPQNVRYTLTDGYAYVTWSPVCNADLYYVYVSSTENGSFHQMYNQSLQQNGWYWGFPHSFGFSTGNSNPVYMKVTAVVNGVETEFSEIMKITWN